MFFVLCGVRGCVLPPALGAPYYGDHVVLNVFWLFWYTNYALKESCRKWKSGDGYGARCDRRYAYQYIVQHLR